MTVCIAAACENGTKMVTATDGLLSMGDVTGDVVPGKMLWYKDWQLMYAGVPANFSMISEEITKVGMDDPDALSRRRMPDTVRQAYVRVRSNLASFRHLSAINLSLPEFLSNGSGILGEKCHEEVMHRIMEDGRRFEDQVLVTGWGHSPYAFMLYEVGPDGEWMHSAGGFAAIGCGCQMAQTMLLLLGQARHSSLAETIFNVACAKFFSEKSRDLDVGRMTTMYVSRKRTKGDDPEKLCGDFVTFEELDTLRGYWDRYVKPRFPNEARIEITSIAARLNKGKISTRDAASCITAAASLDESAEQSD
jgi:hypothetical protein